MKFAAPLALALTLALNLFATATHAQDDSTAAAAKIAAKIVGPTGTDKDTCSNCHDLETKAWTHTHHFSSFKELHRTPEAKKILAAMGIKSMKRSDTCLNCHYTSVIKHDKVRPTWGVSCESCHGAARDWLNIHNKVGGVASAKAVKWGEGRKKETPAQLKARLGPAIAKGMITSDMIYGIATNCFSCHTVPNEKLVNVGGHKAGSDFDLVSWSQGEIRHNFSTSAGAPDNPTNRPATKEELRRLYAVGALVDLEVSLRNLASVKDKGGKFQTAMVERVNHARDKAAPVVAAAGDAKLTAAFKAIPAKVTADSKVTSAMADALGKAAKGVQGKAGGLAALDGKIPTKMKGTAFTQ
ncbi:MAG: multiheme c-type cytochrome [Rhodanobacteraceae bacterium]